MDIDAVELRTADALTVLRDVVRFSVTSYD